MIDTLTIDCIAARAPDDASGLAARVERIVRRVADARLDQLLGSYSFAADGEWCLGRVAVDVELDFERPDSALEEGLARAVLDAITVAARGPEVLHYPNRIEALADLVAAAAVHRGGAAWAWLRMGLIDDAEEFERHPESGVLDALGRSPEHIVAAIVRAVRVVGLPAVHRLLGEQGWIRLADIVVRMSADVRQQVPLAAMVGQGHAGASADTVDIAAGRPHTVGAQSSETQARMAHIRSASRLLSGSALAREARASRLRLDGPAVRALVLLIVAEIEPALLRRSTAVPVCLTVADLLSGATPMPPGASGPATDTRPEGRLTEAAAAPGSTDSATQARDGCPVVADTSPDDGGDPVGDETDHAGLLFLLNAAADAAMPDALLADPALDGLDATELLARIAMTLAPVGADDPATLAFAGVVPRRTRHTWFPALPEPLTARIDVHAAAWVDAARRRLERPDDDHAAVIAEMICRHGRIEHEPGWIDVHLSLGDVSVDLRRAALDIDPGWVPWLGSVVRFRYE